MLPVASDEAVVPSAGATAALPVASDEVVVPSAGATAAMPVASDEAPAALRRTCNTRVILNRAASSYVLVGRVVST